MYTILNTTPTKTSVLEFTGVLTEISNLDKLDAHLKDLVTAAVENLKCYFGYEPEQKLINLIPKLA
jgi:hypothetical protein